MSTPLGTPISSAAALPAPEEIEVDLLIVGAGPAGLYAAYCGGFRGLRITVIDNLPEPGGQVAALYPEKLIYDVAALPAVRGRDLVENLISQAEAFGPTYLLGEQATSASPASPSTEGGPPRWLVGTDHGRRINCGAIVVTGGIGRFTPRPLPVAAAWEGSGLTYHVRHLAEHTGRDVVIVGGGDSAVDWALALQPIAASVTLVHRRAKFRAHEASVEALRKSPCTIITDAQITDAQGDERLREVTVRHSSGEHTTLTANSLIVALGFTADLGPLESWGIEIVDRRIVVDTAMRTFQPGIYAAGDITDYRGKVRLISVGFGEAALAVNNAATHLDPQLSLAPGHSTDNTQRPAAVA